MSRAQTIAAVGLSVYPERRWPREGMLDEAALLAAGAAHRLFRRMSPDFIQSRFVDRVNGFAADVSRLSNRDLKRQAVEAGNRLRRAKQLDGHEAAYCFALIREAGGRVLPMRAYDVQIACGHAILRQTIAEMRAGEGKTLVATLPAATAALAGVPVHVVTVNDYLAERDAGLMSPLYAFFGLSVGVIKQGMSAGDRSRAYDCDIAYCTNKELAFDYLKDSMARGARTGELNQRCERFLSEERGRRTTVLRGLHFAIVDEADSVMVDEARTPLIISGRAPADTAANEKRARALDIARELSEDRHYKILRDERRVELTPAGCEAVGNLPVARDKGWEVRVVREELIRQAVSAIHIFHRDRDYIVRDGKVVIVDEHTGRLMEDRSWSVGLHQMIEIKEGCEPSAPMQTLARMTYQRFFRRYCMLGGMSGTVREVAPELWSVYRLQVTPIPTNKPQQVRVKQEAFFPTAAAKWQEMAARVRAIHETGAPVLIGTGSIQASLEASHALDRAGLKHVVLNAEQSRQEAEIVAVAGQRNAITVATNMAGRGTDIKLGLRVERLGGLHVIMTERHDTRRVDRQLSGRCGRQGDPGSVEAVLSLQDPLLVEWSPHFARAGSFLLPLLGNRLGGLFMWFAQRKAEKIHARMRRDLLKADRTQDDNLAFSGARH
jgi:preprotein translocase subunit SecA